jgi:hypothetical protein
LTTLIIRTVIVGGKGYRRIIEQSEELGFVLNSFQHLKFNHDSAKIVDRNDSIIASWYDGNFTFGDHPLNQFYQVHDEDNNVVTSFPTRSYAERCATDNKNYKVFSTVKNEYLAKKNIFEIVERDDYALAVEYLKFQTNKKVMNFCYSWGVKPSLLRIHTEQTMEDAFPIAIDVEFFVDGKLVEISTEHIIKNMKFFHPLIVAHYDEIGKVFDPLDINQIDEFIADTLSVGVYETFTPTVLYFASYFEDGVFVFSFEEQKQSEYDNKSYYINFTK